MLCRIIITAWQKVQKCDQAQEKQTTNTPEYATTFLFSYCFDHILTGASHTNAGVYEKVCFILEKQCFSDWQLVFKQGSGHLQSYFLFLQQCKERRKSHLVFQDLVQCCIFSADNWTCNMASFFWNIFQPSCNYFSFVLNMLLLVGVAKLVIVLACRYTRRGVRAPSLTNSNKSLHCKDLFRYSRVFIWEIQLELYFIN